jgi:hypothetical protein
LVAARLLEMAADQFSNHGCSDMPDGLLDGLSPDDLEALERTANRINGNEDEGYVIPLRNFGDSGLMGILASRVKEAAA